MLLNWELRCALASFPELSAAMDLFDLEKNPAADLSNVEKLADALEKHVSPMDTQFFQKVFKGTDVHLSLQDVPTRLQGMAQELRSIVRFRKGKLAETREFCLSLNRTLASLRWSELTQRRNRRYLAA